jgi:hypothetical protein
MATAMRLVVLQNSAWMQVTPLPDGVYEVCVKNEPRDLLRQLAQLGAAPEASTGRQRQVEVVICEPNAGGDTGIWYTEYVDIPAATPDEEAEAAAIAAWHAEHDGKPDTADVAHIGLYWLPPAEDNADEETETEAE